MSDPERWPRSLLPDRRRRRRLSAWNGPGDPLVTVWFVAPFPIRTYTVTSPMAYSAFSRIAAPAAMALSFVAVHAQSPAEPTAYTVTVKYQITGAALRTTYRLGSKVLVSQVPSIGIFPNDTPAAPTRTLYLLDSRQSLTWEPANTHVACTRDTFQGDAWLDPFSGASDLAMPSVTRLGSEVIHGIPTIILVSKAKRGFKLWVDPKTGLMLKADFAASSGRAVTYFEVTEVHFEQPPAELFKIPAHCALDSNASNSKPRSN